jgi:hypothetical protein
MGDRHLPEGRVVIVLAVSIAMLLMGATMVLANHNFSDVPTSAFYHSAVDWGVDRGLVSGCGSGKFCPNSPITRGQAMFILKGMANVVSPHVLSAEEPQVPHVDIDPKPVVCQTTTWKRSYEEIAFGMARTSIEPEITDLAYVGRVVYQANGGAWIVLAPTKMTPTQAHAFNEDKPNYHFGVLNLSPNVTYKFGIQLESGGHTTGNSQPEGDYECALVVKIFNRNP